MSGLLHKTLLSTSAVGISLLATAPAFGAGLTGATLNGGSYLLYEQQGTTSTVLNNNADLATLLQGDINGPGGNIELSGMLGNANAASTSQATTLSGFLNGEAISVSSLTGNDWLTSYGGYNSFAEKWFSEAWNHADTGLQSWFADKGATNYNSAFSAFLFGGGYARFSDPNVNYVNQNSNGDISIGLAGHLNHDSGLQLSEVVKVNYGGETHFLYGLGQALASGLVNDQGEGADGVSHTGLYNLTIPGEPSTDIPEPSTMLGLLAIGGLFGLTKRNNSNA